MNCMLFCADDTCISTSSMQDEDDACEQPNNIEMLSSNEITNEEDKVEEYFDSSDDENQSRPYITINNKISSDGKDIELSDEQNDNGYDECLDKNAEESELPMEETIDDDTRNFRNTKRRRR